MEQDNSLDPTESRAISRRGFLLGVAGATGAVALVACSTNPAATPSTAAPAATGATSTAALPVRMITPPRLDTAYLGEEILCYRPMRRGAPNLSVETVDGRTIGHNYGHGGSGWTLAPGSAAYVVDEVEAATGNGALAKDAPITVLGAGVIGLFTAYELVKRGYTNVTVMAASFENLTSHNAGGLLAPVSMDNAPEMQAVIDKIGIDAYRFFADVARGKHPDFDEGAVIIPAYFQSREESGLEPYVGQVMEPAKDVILDFGNGTTQPMVAYDDGIFMDPGLMMKDLTDYLKPRVTFVQKKVNSLAEVPGDVVFDCSGLGAGKLNNDSEMVSVQGHLVMLKDQVPADMQYMILVYFAEGKTESGQKVKRSLYVFPKHLPGSGPNDIGVVGGTFIEGATPETPNEAEFATMMQGARDFYGV
jgi:D-amino-acid oxidase